MIIPKIIHFVWVGTQEKPELVKKCIESWKKFCPDYKIMEWNNDHLEKPIQIHYVTWTTWAKPWKDINAPLANLWYRYLTYTNFFTEFFITKNKKHKKRFLWW